ncbi:MAG TPA: LPS export ABC transporter periplasmic protein LptC [Gammaproteobacteria bacterium]
MYKRLRNALALCLLIAAAAGTWYWSRPQAPPPAPPEPGDNPPGYYVRDAVILETGEDGRALYRVHAELAQERPEDGALLLEGVRVEYQSEEQIPWRVRAARAQASTEGSALELEGDVELARDPVDDGAGTLIRTEHLVLLPEQHLARADGNVSITVDGSTLEAVGLRAFLKEDRVELESNVHGRFQP